MSAPELQARLDDFARRLRALERELAELRSSVTERREPSPSERRAAEAEVAQPPARAELPLPPLQQLPRPSYRPRRSEAARSLPNLQLSDLLGARALAVSGGIVTVLGILFFFVLAVNRGWIGSLGRVSLGGTASTCVFLAGLLLRRRYGQTHSALAAVGAGLAGGYATLLAAAALYGFVPDYTALLVAAAIAAAGVATSLAWDSQIIAGLGLIGAMLVPAAVAAQGGLSALGTSFVAIVLAATSLVAVKRGWRDLLAVGGLASLAQIAALIFRDQYHGEHPVRIVLLAALFSALYVASGMTLQLASSAKRLEQLTVSFVFGGGALAALAAIRLFGTLHQRGAALLVVAIAFGLLAGALFRKIETRDLSALASAVGFTVGAIAFADLLSGQQLAYAWAAESAALVWLARRTREVRFELWSALYLGLALAHVLAVDATLARLFVSHHNPTAGAPAPVAVALAAWSFGHFARRPSECDEPVVGPLAGVLARFTELRGRDVIAFWLAGISATYAVSLATLGLFASFGWGHVALAGLWSALGLGLVLAGHRVRAPHMRRGGLASLWVMGAVVVVHGAISLDTAQRSWSFLILAAGVLGAGLAEGLLASDTEESFEVAAFSALASVALAIGAIHGLATGKIEFLDLHGTAELGLAAVYGGIGIAVARSARRNLATLLWALGLLLGAASAGELLSGTYLVLAWAAAAVALGRLSHREPRLLAGAALYALVGLVHVLAIEAPPRDLFVARVSPASGVPAVLIEAAAIAILASRVRSEPGKLGRGVSVSWWLAGALAVYGISLSILNLVELVFPHASLQTDFQRGHTAVSAFWGALGLALLYAGLTRWRSLRIAGFALFAVSLMKIFLFDLPSLSSITRAFSFLAVGAVLLAGGFFYQRLSSGRHASSQGYTRDR